MKDAIKTHVSLLRIIQHVPLIGHTFQPSLDPIIEAWEEEAMERGYPFRFRGHDVVKGSDVTDYCDPDNYDVINMADK